MPQDPQQESTSAEQLFKRLRDTADADLPAIPDAPDIFKVVDSPTQAGFGLHDQDREQRRILEEQRAEKQSEPATPAVEEGPQSQLEVLQEILAELRVLQGSIDNLAGGA